MTPETNPSAAPGELELVRRFVNSVDLESDDDAFETLEGLSAWLRGAGMIGTGVRLSEAERLQAVEFREGLRQLLLAHHGDPLPADAVSRLNGAVDGVLVRPRFRDGGAVLEATGSGMALVLGELMGIVYRAMAEGTWERMKACSSDTCQWAFYDHSKNRSGKWCSMAVCGNRAKARAYRERQAETAETP